MKKATPWKIRAILACVLVLVALAVIDQRARHRWPVLSEANCQVKDVGATHFMVDKVIAMTHPPLGETPVDSHAITLTDLQLTYTMVTCRIYRFENVRTAKRAFQSVCPYGSDAALAAGDEACVFAGYAPRRLAFRRDVYLVLMSGDINILPVGPVDRRLR